MHEKSYGIIPVKEGLVYIVKHASGNYWGFPKGRPHLGETPEETALRELREETALRPVQLDTDRPYMEAYSFERDGDTIHKTVLYFLAEVSGDACNNADDVLEGKWVPLDACSEHLTFEQNKKIAHLVRQHYG